jgi:hypothetical protein
VSHARGASLLAVASALTASFVWALSAPAAAILPVAANAFTPAAVPFAAAAILPSQFGFIADFALFRNPISFNISFTFI